MELEIGKIVFRTVISYIIIVFVFRLMGKREIGELSLMDIVVFIMVAEMAVFSIEDTKMRFLHSLIPIVILFLIQRFTAFLSLKNQKFRGWFEGKPSVIISRGKIDEREMRRQRYNFNDLMQQLRENGTKSIQDVEFAILESSGKLSIFEKSEGEQAVSADGYAVPVVVDGKIQQSALEKINKDEAWLMEELEKGGHLPVETISFCSVDGNNRWFVDRKDERK
ncbi:DUF421 domain-containing protein [Sediminibacillus massiliensis]|uniref:DUF421 domain-containing protein n=1 Tax=Sediminibacillus massiliensis TaxID=1926277 RepID=UPI000988718D|nr:DUF421 domain-containing protein [Sediminibacillus massiliensis]